MSFEAVDDFFSCNDGLWPEHDPLFNALPASPVCHSTGSSASVHTISPPHIPSSPTPIADDAFWSRLSPLQKQAILRPVLDPTLNPPPPQQQQQQHPVFPFQEQVAPPTFFPVSCAPLTTNAQALAPPLPVSAPPAVPASASPSSSAGSYSPPANTVTSTPNPSPTASAAQCAQSPDVDAPKRKKRDRVSDAPDDSLDADQLNKRQRRRELNKLAAQRSRQKKQQKTDTLEEQVMQLKQDKERLQERIQALESENANLRHSLCNQQQQPQPQQQQQQLQHAQQQQSQHQPQPQPQITQHDTLYPNSSRDMMKMLTDMLTTTRQATVVQMPTPLATPGVPPVAKKATFALMSLSLVALVVWSAATNDATPGSPTARTLRSAEKSASIMNHMHLTPSFFSWASKSAASMDVPVFNASVSQPTSSALVPVPTPRVTNAATQPAEPEAQPIVVGEQGQEMMQVVDDDAAEGPHTPPVPATPDVPFTEVRHKVARVEPWEAAEFLRTHGREDTSYIFVPEAHLIQLSRPHNKQRPATATSAKTPSGSPRIVPTPNNTSDHHQPHSPIHSTPITPEDTASKPTTISILLPAGVLPWHNTSEGPGTVSELPADALGELSCESVRLAVVGGGSGYLSAFALTQ